ncbi:MAG: hypothetical protein QXH42_03695 [Thermoplasmata archaeon]
MEKAGLRSRGLERWSSDGRCLAFINLVSLAAYSPGERLLISLVALFVDTAVLATLNMISIIGCGLLPGWFTRHFALKSGEKELRIRKLIAEISAWEFSHGEGGEQISGVASGA